MTTALQVAGATADPSSFAPLHINRMTTGLWTNSNPLRDAASSLYEEKFYGGRQDRLVGGLNCEISPRITLHRRPGLRAYNANSFPAIKRFYSWNLFTVADETIRVLADTANVVYDVTHKADGTDSNTALWTKAPGAGSTYFLGVGNMLFFTNGVENKQIEGTSGEVFDWGIAAPVNAPTVTQQPRPNPYPGWQANTAYSSDDVFGLAIEDSNYNIQRVTTFGVTGTQAPTWDTRPLYSTPDGTVIWQNNGESGWVASHNYSVGDAVVGSVVDSTGLNIATLFWCTVGGQSGTQTPAWTAGVGSLTGDGPVVWRNAGNLLYWPDIGPGVSVVGNATIVDSNGYLQSILQSGKSGAAPPTWQSVTGAITQDGTVIWVNQGPFASGTTAPVQYGYEYMNSKTVDLSNMSPPSAAISVSKGAQVVVQGDGSTASGADTVVVFRTLQGGSTFGYLGQVAMPPPGQKWTFIDTPDDATVNMEWQAQINGEGTPLPTGATCLEFHAGHIFAAVLNVVYVSSGPDAVVGGSSGNAGFDTTFTCQSKIIRFWASPLGLVVFTVRDTYIISGSGISATATSSGDPFWIQRWINNLPLLNYDAFDVNLTTPLLLTGNRMVMSLDPAAGLVEMSYPIADLVAANFDPKAAYLTYHTAMTGEAAWFLSDGVGSWYRLSTVTAPDSGFVWNPMAQITGGMSAVQSVETSPGVHTLLVGPPAGGGVIRQRDFTVNTDTGTAYAMNVDIGSIVLAAPGQLAGLAWITTESLAIGTAPTMSLLMNEIAGTYQQIRRTRQDPPNLPASQSIFANRHSVLQGQSPVWCRHFRMLLEWPAEDAANELLTYTVFGQIWQELRSA